MKADFFRISGLFLGVVVATSWVAPARGGTEQFVRTGDGLPGKIAVLRAAGDYSAALDLAREEYSRASARGSVQNTRLADFERLIATLSHIASLPDASRKEMARADGLVASYDSLHQDARYAEAAASVQEALDIQTTYLGGDHHEVGSSQARLAFAKQNLGDLDGAEPIYSKALAVLRKNLGESHPDIAEVLTWTGIMYLKQGKYDRSEQVLHEALEMYRQTTDASRGIAITLNDLAHLMFVRGDHPGSERVHKEAIEMWRRIGEEETPRCATTLDNLGIVYVTQGRHAEAEPLYRKALALRREHLRWDHPDVAVSLNNLGGLYYVLGNYAEAEPLYREALAIKRKTLAAGHQSLALGVSNLAAVALKQGDIEEAERLFREALEIFETTLPPGHAYIGLVSNNLASVIAEKGDYARAESLHTEALSIYRNSFGEKHENVATLLNNIAKDKIERGDYSGAEARFGEALDIYEQQFGPIHPNVANSRANMGAMLIRQERYAEAEAELRRALSIYDNLLMSSSPDAVTAKSLLGSVLVQTGDIAGAIETLESACELFEVARRRVSVGGLRRTAYTASDSPYPGLAVAYLDRGDQKAAWESVEKDNGRGLLDMLQTRSVRRLTDEEIAEERRLDGELGKLESSWIALANDSTASGTEKADSIRTVLLQAQSRWARFQSRLADRYPIAEGRSYTMENIQSTLEDNCAIVGWLDVKEKHYAYVLAGEGPVIWEKLPAARIDSLARIYRKAVTAGSAGAGDHRGPGEKLYAARFEPLEKHLTDIKRIVVIPSGAMLGIPVEALRTAEGQYMVDRWEVSYSPSATILAWLQKLPKPEGEPSLFVLGDPPFDERQAREMAMNAGATGARNAVLPDARSDRRGVSGDRVAITELKPLSGSRKEALDIAAFFATSDVLLGEDANEANLVTRAINDEFSRYHYVHLATHAIIDEKKAERSCLVLSQVDLPDPVQTVISGGRIVDGRLTMDEVLREWRLNANLVTLSACETALGREVRGEGYIGFAHAFFHAGTRSVVVSLWQVDDRATTRLMVRFYENMLERGMSRSEALRESKRWLRDLEGRGGIRPFSHPAYWAGFVLIGDPD